MHLFSPLLSAAPLLSGPGTQTLTATPVNDSVDGFGAAAIAVTNDPPNTPSITAVLLDDPLEGDVTLVATAYSDPESNPSGGRRWRIYYQVPA
jgi:hypothetical protein